MSRARETTSGPTPEAALHVALLGPPAVAFDGRPLTVPRRQVRGLLYRLAAEPGPLPREELGFLFWPDVAETVARRHLSRLLTCLRRALPDAGLLLTPGDQIGLDAARVWSDAAAFARLCSGGKARAVTGALQQAVAWYSGPFLQGFSLPECPEFELWLSQERSALEQLYLEAHEALIEEGATRGDYGAAIAHAQAYLETDCLAESVHRRLMELYALSGDRSAALRHYERCVVILERELGVGPMAETQAVHQAVLQGRPATAPVAAPVWDTLPSLDTAMVGRDQPLAVLKEAFAQASRGGARFVLITGEPGIGKSRLLAEFVGGLRGGGTVLAGAGHEGEQSLPYWPPIQALRPHLPALSTVEPVYLAELQRLLPEIRSLYPDVPAPSRDELGQDSSPGAGGRLFQALAMCIRALAQRRPPLLLCIDDLHWADQATLGWLGFLARSMRAAPLLVVGACRSEEMAAVAGLRAQLARRQMLAEIRLVGLSLPEVHRLIRGLSGLASETAGLAERLYHETGGNPFFLLETLRSMFEVGELSSDGRGWVTAAGAIADEERRLPVADSVSEAVNDRLRRLDARARQVLEAAAVIGERFEFDLLYRTSGRRESEVVDGLEALVGRQLVSSQGALYRFQHDLIREVVYRGLSHGRRRLLHRRAAEALQRLRPSDAATLARHFEQADQPGRAAGYALSAGQAARAVFAYAEARTCFDNALQLMDEEDQRRPKGRSAGARLRLRVQVLEGRGWAFRLLGDMDAYDRDTREVARLVERLADQQMLAHLRWREAYGHRWFCRYAEALSSAEDGVSLSQAVGVRLTEAMCWREVGMVTRACGDYARAGPALERALALFAELGETTLEIHALGNLSTMHWCLDEYAEAMGRARLALDRCEAAQLPLERRLPLGDMGAAAAAMGDRVLARQCLRESLTIAQQVADRTQEIVCLGHLGWLAARQGDLVEAQQWLGEALRLAERINSCTEQAWLHAGLAEAYRQAGRADQARAHADRAVVLAQATGRAWDQELAAQIRRDL
jgi:DNA-binding SARP family transcriptional activator/tetratricopeptide (TPR) repeat protein